MAGQFAEVVYSDVPLEFLFENASALAGPDLPLEGYNALQDVTLVSFVKGHSFFSGDLKAFVAYRPQLEQLVVSVSGTAHLKHAVQDLRVSWTSHPCRGDVHTGFWKLYQSIKSPLLEAINKGLDAHKVKELVMTGHSMGGTICYLLCIDILTEAVVKYFPQSGLKLKLAVFGSPRSGDLELVEYWRELVSKHRENYGADGLIEYSVKAYNDGMNLL